MEKKTKLQRFLYGIKLGIKLSLLPKSVENFHNYPLVRIFRVIGGISIILFLYSPEWIGNLENSYIYWIIFILAMLHFLYILIISSIKICYLIYLWKNKKLEVRNSPLDQIASLSIKLAACIKGACVAGGASATVLGLGFGADKLLEEAGYPPFFKKAMGNQLGKILTNLGYNNNNEYLELQKKMLNVKQRTNNIGELNKIINEIENNDAFIGLKNDLQEFKDEFSKELQREQNIKKVEESKILAELKNIKKNW